MTARLISLALAFASSLIAAQAAAFSPQNCRFVNEDGSVTIARLFTPEWGFAEPTEDYSHAVLGDGVEYRSVGIVRFPYSRTIKLPDGIDLSHFPRLSDAMVTLDETHVFEDLAPRPFDWTPRGFHLLSGIPELGLNAVVVETDMARGASLAVYKAGCKGVEKVAATAPIGQAHRWLAPAGIADFDGDGQKDIAYVETPHLSGTLKVVTLKEGALVPITTPLAGFSNHRIGEDFITSAVKSCGGQPALILPDFDWSGLRSVTIEGGEIISREIEGDASPEGVRAAAQCPG